MYFFLLLLFSDLKIGFAYFVTRKIESLHESGNNKPSGQWTKHSLTNGIWANYGLGMDSMTKIGILCSILIPLQEYRKHAYSGK